MPYFSLSYDTDAKAADIYIFGDIASNRGGLGGLLQSRSDQSSYDLANQIAGIPEDYSITVHINSNGGEIKEGLGIYNVLKERDVTTVCEGFAASAGSVIFAAGTRRIMQPASLLFIHQASMQAAGNTDDFAKYSEDLKIITDAAVAAYKESGVNVSDEELNTMLKRETWITPEDAVRMGFATEISDAEEDDTTDESGIPVVKNDAMRSIKAAVTRPAGSLGSIEIEADGLENVLQRFTDLVDDHAELLSLAEKALAKVDEDPELLTKLKAVADIVLATNPTPSPALGRNKGFFNF